MAKVRYSEGKQLMVIVEYTLASLSNKKVLQISPLDFMALVTCNLMISYKLGSLERISVNVLFKSCSKKGLAIAALKP